jgi:hypothetical protein
MTETLEQLLKNGSEITGKYCKVIWSNFFLAYEILLPDPNGHLYSPYQSENLEAVLNRMYFYEISYR